MVILSLRRSLKNWFLVQNSWRNLSLFVASQAYLVKHLTHQKEIKPVFYVKGDTPFELPTVIQARGALYLSTEFDDGGEEMEEDLEDGDNDVSW